VTNNATNVSPSSAELSGAYGDVPPNHAISYYYSWGLCTSYPNSSTSSNISSISNPGPSGELPPLQLLGLLSNAQYCYQLRFGSFKILTALSARPSAQRTAECGSHVDSYLARAPLIRLASRTTRRALATPAERRWSSPPPAIRHLPTTDQWSMRTLCAHPNTSSRRQTERAASCYCLSGPRQLPSPHRPLGQYIWHLLSCPSLHLIRTQLRCTRCPGRATSGC